MSKNTLFFLIIFSRFLGAGICSEKDYLTLASSLKESGHIQESINYYKKVLAINPNNFDANFVLACELYVQNNLQESLKYFDKLSELFPDNPSMLSNIGKIHSKLGNLQKAVTFFYKSLEIDDTQMDLYKKLGVIFLKFGQLDKGYGLYDHFYQIEDKTEKRLWDGFNLSGKTIFIFDNIGIGDVFCFIPYAKYMKEQGATVVLGLRESLIPIMSSFAYVDKIVPRFSDFRDFDCYIYMNKLPRMAHKAGFGVPCNVPYIFPDYELVEKWEQEFSKDHNFKIGICWEASVLKNKETGEIVSRDRSIPLYYFYALSKLKNVSLYSLQRINGVDQLEYMPKDFDIHIFDENFDKEKGSFSDTAAVMKNLDLVITVDTSIAHLAGALGVPVWLILDYNSNWRWFVDREDSPWYPTMRIFRQKSIGNWDLVIDNVVENLQEVL